MYPDAVLFEILVVWHGTEDNHGILQVICPPESNIKDVSRSGEQPLHRTVAAALLCSVKHIYCLTRCQGHNFLQNDLVSEVCGQLVGVPTPDGLPPGQTSVEPCHCKNIHDSLTGTSGLKIYSLGSVHSVSSLRGVIA